MTSQKKSVWSWALYDAGNSAFATVVMAGFFPVFFKSYWSSGSDVTVTTAQLGMANAAAGLLVALLAPLLGAVADSGQAKKKFLSFFAFLGIAGTAALVFVQKGCWQYAAALYVAGAVGFSGANIFYDSLLPSIADRKNIHRTSALGFSLGYLGGGLLFAFCVWMTLSPATFGLVSEELQMLSKEIIEAARASAIKSSFVLTALWWAVLTVPLLLFVKEPAPVKAQKSARPVQEGIRQLSQTFREIRRIKPVWLFLLAYWFYIDGVNTIIRMAVDYGMSLGFSYTDLICALLITQFVGFPCALLFGRLGQRWGPKNALYIAIAGYLVIVLWGAFMRDKTEFYILAILIGLVQGGIQALSRSYYSRLIPQDKTAQFYGFYNMVGKYAVVFGPALMGISGYLTRSPRAGIATLSVFFIIGGILLFLVDEKNSE
jgi:UMF1 family MFS transporter